MFPRSLRLKRNNDIGRVLKSGIAIKGKYLIIKIVTNNLPNSRFGFITSLKVSKKAVIRNKVKRILRDIARKQAKTFTDHKDILVIALPTCAQATYQQLNIDLQSCFARIKTLK
ncbi:MAG: ribonuclease P protein component [Candidatus Paceibacterota bacterium]